jgi:hypothetical protein
MKIFFAGIQLTDWSAYPAQNVSVNGQTVFEAVDIVRAAAKRFYYRQNDSVSLSFSAHRKFATHHEAQVFVLTHFSTLPKFGLCTIVCGVAGEDGAQIVTMENAVLTAMPQGIFGGVGVVVSYTIQAGAAFVGSSADVLIGDEDMILRNKTAIATDAESVPVVFSEAFPPETTVIVNATYAKGGSGGANIVASVRDDLVTPEGFTAELSGPSPAGAYLYWSAFGL